MLAPPFSYETAAINAVARRALYVRCSLLAADLGSALLALALVIASSAGHLDLTALLLAPLVVIPAKLAGLYDRDQLVLNKSTIEELAAILRVAAVSSVLMWLFYEALDRSDVIALFGGLLVLLVVSRMLARATVARLLPGERCLLVGDPGAVDHIAAKLERHGAELVGFLPLLERRRDGDLAPCAALNTMVEKLRVDRVVVAPGINDDADATLNAITRAKAMGAHVSILPRLFEVVGSSVQFDHVGGLVMLGVRRFGLTRSSRMIKRTADLVGAGLALLVAAPVMAAVAVAIRLDSRGPLLYRQTRVGRNGEPFTMLKFRTMFHGADQLREELRALSNAGDGMFKVPHDPRVTRVGRVLRRTSLDELPQLLNVLRGEMSLVGPRPLVVEEDALIEGWHRRRLHLTPGLTGPWQVLGSGDSRVPLRDMVTIDYLYAANWSLWSDAKVLMRTVWHVCRARGV